ncbi:unnamed protein product [Arctogadus glacialis]
MCTCVLEGLHKALERLEIEDHGSVSPAFGNLYNLRVAMKHIPKKDFNVSPPIWNGPSTDDTSSSGCDTCSSAIEERFNHNTTTTTTSSFLKTHSKGLPERKCSGFEGRFEEAAKERPTLRYAKYILGAEFQALYEEQKHLGTGGHGSVWAGYRKQDNRQSVAIKHIPMKNVVMAEGNDWPTYFPLEIALMLKVQGEGGSASPGAAVLLLDWFNLDQELILVLERPVLSTDLLRYMKPKGYLEEQEAKMIMQQVIKAITDIHSKGVLHRDIKPENILIETGSDVPRVRIIDFGCGCLLHNGEHHQFSGTFGYCPPEWFEHQSYRAEPLNVWQVGVLAYRMLVGKHPFSTKKEIISKEPCIGRGLSPNCQEFVLSCLAKQPQERLPLDSLLAHPWLR